MTDVVLHNTLTIGVPLFLVCCAGVFTLGLLIGQLAGHMRGYDEAMTLFARAWFSDATSDQDEAE